MQRVVPKILHSTSETKGKGTPLLLIPHRREWSQKGQVPGYEALGYSKLQWKCGTRGSVALKAMG